MISQLNPRVVSTFFQAVRTGKEYTKDTLLARIEKIGKLKARDRVMLPELLGILASFEVLNVDEQEHTFTLSTLGASLKSLLLRNEGLFFEIYHLLSYYAFDLNKGDYDFLPFKSYMLLSDSVFNAKTYPKAKNLADEINRTITETFQVQGSFSEVCITRGLAWLKKLAPPLFDDKNNYVDRTLDYSEVLLLNLSYFYQVDNRVYGDPLALDDAVKDRLARANLMATLKIEDTLKVISQSYPKCLDFKYNISGSYVVLKKEVLISDLV